MACWLLGSCAGFSIASRASPVVAPPDTISGFDTTLDMHSIRMPWFPIVGCLLLHGFGQGTDGVEKVVEKLYPKSERLKEIRMGDIVRELGIREGSRVADVGCGSGQFSAILANVVGNSGHVYCEDINDNKQFGLGQAKTNLKKQHVKNVDLIHGMAEDPKLPAGLDAVLIVNANHEMPKDQARLQHINESLKAGRHLVLVDNTPLPTAKRPRRKQTQNSVLPAEPAA